MHKAPLYTIFYTLHNFAFFFGKHISSNMDEFPEKWLICRDAIASKNQKLWKNLMRTFAFSEEVCSTKFDKLDKFYVLMWGQCKLKCWGLMKRILGQIESDETGCHSFVKKWDNLNPIQIYPSWEFAKTDKRVKGLISNVLREKWFKLIFLSKSHRLKKTITKVINPLELIRYALWGIKKFKFDKGIPCI